MKHPLAPQIRSFIDTGHCLIVEPSQSFSSSLQASLSEMGIPASQISIARKFHDARRLVKELKPKLLVTEYDLPPEGLGLGLIELQEELVDERHRISIIVTKNSSDSAVAEAAEGSVDAFILKPFSTDSFRQKLIEIFQRKMNPSPYQKKLKEGQEKSLERAFEQALQAFGDAKGLDEKPTLACFYSGSVYQQLGQVEKAVAEFQLGLKYQPLHYKCLIGEFEAFIGAKDYPRAYGLVSIIRENYPVTSKRLEQILKAAVFTYNFADLESCYELYTRLETRSPELMKLMSLALFTGGKFYLQKKEITQAMVLFDLAMTVQGREIQFMEKVFDELMKNALLQEADLVLSKVPPSEVGGKVHAQMRFRLDQRILPSDKLLERGRKMINDGYGSPEIYELVVSMMAKADKRTLAESMISHAVRDFPEMRAKLYALLETKS